MSFTPHEREALLSARFVGPTVVQRLEEIGFGGRYEQSGGGICG